MPTSPTRRLTQLYTASLAAVAVLSIGGQVLVQQQLRQQVKNLEVVSKAEKQEQMCQTLSKAALAVQFAPSPTLRATHLKDLQDLIQHWEAPSQTLKQEILKLSSNRDAAQLDRLFAQVESQFQTMMQAAKEIVAAAEQRSDRFGRAVPAPIAPRILAVEAGFMADMEAIIQLYNNRIQAGINQLQVIELSLLGLTLLVLALEGWLIFRPAVQKLKDTMSALARSLQETQETARKLAQEQEKSERLLLNILPEPIADRLKNEPQSIAEAFGNVTVLFADIVGFTELSGRLAPCDLVARLNQIFSRFDALAERYGLEKIKTIGDAYMVVGGLPEPRSDHAQAVADMALAMQEEIQILSRELGESFQMRIGINSGPVVAGVIGIKKFIYDLWGDTVNIASRMESHGQPGAIHISAATYRHLHKEYHAIDRGLITVKGKGAMQTYWLQGRIGSSQAASGRNV